MTRRSQARTQAEREAERLRRCQRGRAARSTTLLARGLLTKLAKLGIR